MRAYLGLGSNLGDRQATLQSAIQVLSVRRDIDVIAVSDFLDTEPVGPLPQGRFLNAAAAIATTLPPRDLLAACLAIEKGHGRDRSIAQRWGPRSLDIDLLLYGEMIIAEPGLSVPHPHMHERGFVLIPLAQIAPGARHPGFGKTIAELLQTHSPPRDAEARGIAAS